MLKLVIYTKDHRLKVRHANPEDDFQDSCKWKDKLEFIITDSGSFTIVWTSFIPDLAPEYAEALLDLVAARFPVSEEYAFLTEKCPELGFKNPSDEWVFFGGTFNPWHKGHQACLDLLPADKVCLIMPDRNPHKELREIHQVMTVLEISSKSQLSKNRFLVPTFLLKEEKNPTVNWVEKMKGLFPTDKISLLMGFDSFSQLKTWTRSSDLLPKLHAIYVVSRLEDEEDRAKALDEIHALGSNLNVVFLGNHAWEKISSTTLRNKKGT